MASCESCTPELSSKVVVKFVSESASDHFYEWHFPMFVEFRCISTNVDFMVP